MDRSAAASEVGRPADESRADGATPPSSLEPVGEALPARGEVILIRRSHFFAILIALAFIAGLGSGYLLWGRSPTPQRAIASGSFSAAAGRIEISSGDDPHLGPEDAPVTIIEFSDFNCPYCQRWHRESFRQLLDAYPDQIKFVYKDFPIVGGGTVGKGAAQAANCAGEQGAYWPFHDALFSGLYPLDRSGFERYAQEAGLDAESLLACLDSGRYADEVDDDLRYGAGLGVTGTPTFFINGIPLVGAQPLLRFIEIVNSELGQ